MKNRPLPLFFAAIFVAILALPTTLPAEEQTLVETYRTDAGATFFAVGLQAEELPADLKPEAFEVAIVVDTSSTQTGKFRTASIDAVQQVLAGLPPNASFQLLTSDVQTEALTKSFAGVKDAAAVRAALAALQETTPLGAGDLTAALQGAVDIFDAGSTATPVILIIGSGHSDANIQDVVENLGDLLLDIRGKQIPVNFLAVGNNINYDLLGQIAYQTGGQVIPEAVIEKGMIGQFVPAVLTTSVFWVSGLGDWFGDDVEFFPSMVPPIRADRETFLIGKSGEKLPEMKIQLILETKELQDGLCAWSLLAKPSETTNAFLVALAENAAADDGASLTLAGRSYFDYEKNYFIAEQQASPLADIFSEQDRKIHSEILDDMSYEQSLFDARTQHLSSTEKEDRKAELKQAIIQDVYPMVAADKPFVDKVADQRSMVDVQMRKEVTVACTQADKLMPTDPKGAQEIVENAKQLVRQTGGLSADVRHKMIGQLENKAREASRQVYIQELKFQEQQTKLAAIQERLIAENRVAQDSARLSAVMDRFTALMKARDYENAKLIVESVGGIRGTATAPKLGSLAADWSHTLSSYDRLRDLRDRAMVGVTLSIHETNVVLPDNTPLVYPDPEVWALLTEYRKENYEVMSLVSQTKKEEKIYKALDMETDINVEDAPLQELLDQWKSEFGIDIIVDQKSFESEDMGDPLETSITLNVSGLLFRNALKLVLRQVENDTSYIIRDEVLTLVPTVIAEKTLEIRAYPVGDLVVPIETMGGGNSGGYGNNSGGYGNNSGGYGNNSGGRNSGGRNSGYGNSGGRSGGYYNIYSNDNSTGGIGQRVSYENMLRYNYYQNMNNRGMLYSPEYRGYSVIDTEAQEMVAPQKKTTR